MLHNIFLGGAELFNEPQELAAIWLEKAIITGEGRTCRIETGATVAIKDGKLVDITTTATHKVTGCIGTLYDSFEFKVQDLATDEISHIKL